MHASTSRLGLVGAPDDSALAAVPRAMVSSWLPQGAKRPEGGGLSWYCPSKLDITGVPRLRDTLERLTHPMDLLFIDVAQRTEPGLILDALRRAIPALQLGRVIVLCGRVTRQGAVYSPALATALAFGSALSVERRPTVGRLQVPDVSAPPWAEPPAGLTALVQGAPTIARLVRSRTPAPGIWRSPDTAFSLGRVVSTLQTAAEAFLFEPANDALIEPIRTSLLLELGLLERDGWIVPLSSGKPGRVDVTVLEKGGIVTEVEVLPAPVMRALRVRMVSDRGVWRFSIDRHAVHP